ncbi:MAG: phosphoribosylglycinamide formyltransferase [Actinobacteria bacterium]|nr:phosphoribosylglycinamide formyltransferase [Actinomycetota bacterium]
MKRIVILASGDGSLAQAIIDAISTGQLNAKIVAVISDKPQSRVLLRAEQADISTFVLPMKTDRQEWNQEILKVVTQLDPDLIVSAGFMRVLAPEFVARFRTINTHPALLPLFPGAHAVRDTLAAGESVTGATVHWVDEGLDSGEVISQVRVPILAGDDENSLHERIKIAERSLVVSTIKDLLPTLENKDG